ncbi:hypothetical protein [Actinoplanes sp. NPDC051494]|uniref:hypothetical protein n=1 Tax=Actinoplanes sp. NPDC051494 TaxID=3363907 RepID=UPI003798A6E5
MIKKMLAAVVMVVALVGIGAGPANAASSRVLKTIHLGVTSGQAQLDTVGSTKYFGIWDLAAGHGRVWIDVQVPGGRTIRYYGIDNDFYQVHAISYTVASWRLCDPYATYCTAWVKA